MEKSEMRHRLSTYKVHIVATLIAAAMAGASAQQQRRQQDVDLQAAIRTETVDGDLNAAIKQYEAIATKYKADRAVMATALVHMAECYRKLGDAESQKIYERIVREFADQRDQVELARVRLSPATAARVKNDRAVWSGATVDLTGRVSPDGRFITFVDWADGRLMLHDVTTNVDRALTPAAVPIYSQSAQWSAISRDGKQVVYEWSANGRAAVRIATVPASGFVEPRQIILASAASFSSFDWAPDGKSIATAFERPDGTGEIGVIAVADGSFRSLKSIDRSALNSLRSSTSIFISLDGKYIAYDRPATESSRQRDAFVLSIADGREIPVVVHGANDAVMGWSPDGSRLLFSSDRTGSIGLWAQPFSDGRPQGSPELLKSDIGPTYSLGVTSAGTLYAYKRINTRDIAIAPVDLEAGKLLGPPVSFTQGFVEGARNPVWSPDGKLLAYPVDCNNGCLSIRSIATGQVRRVGSALTESRVPDWSPDGRALLLKSRDVKGRDGIFQIDVQSGAATPVILGDGLSVVAQWSPDGKKVYFNRRGVFVEWDIASRTEREINGEMGEPFGDLSPDGQHFAVARADRVANTASLLLVPVSGGPARELLRVNHPEALFRPAAGGWTPDSSALIIQKYTGSRWELWLIPVTGGRPRKLDIDPDVWRAGIGTSNSGTPLVQQGDSGFSLSPDGTRIAFVVGRVGSEVWALENFLPRPVPASQGAKK